MATTRVKKISNSLNEIKDSHLFLKISMKDGKYSANRVQISSHKTTWAKNPKIVYSPETGLAGVYVDVVDFLKSRSDRNDESAAEVLEKFKQDKLITEKNHSEFLDYITKITMNFHENKKSTTKTTEGGKSTLIDRDSIVDFLKHVREVRAQSGTTGKSLKTDIIQVYLDSVRGTDKVFRIHGCDSSGKTGDNKLRTAERESLSKTTIPLAETGDLSYFYIPASYEEKRYVVNFMSLYFMHVDGIKQVEANTKARSFAEDLLLQYKKTRGRKSSPKHSSQKSRSSSTRRDSSLKVKRSSSSVKSIDSARERSVSRSRGKSVPTRSPSVSPRRSSSVAPHSKSPKRSSSPGTSPVQNTAVRKFRLPSKKP